MVKWGMESPVQTGYASDLSAAQWERAAALLPKTGHPPKHARRAMVNAMLYLGRTGCQWRNLPHDFPPWGSVWELFWRWRESGLLARSHATLRDACRQQDGRKAAPSAAILDSQSLKTTEKGGLAVLTQAKMSRAESVTFCWKPTTCC